ncbi:MAG: helix-turn-helix domain-containing protein [Vicinamibacterales bacterium]
MPLLARHFVQEIVPQQQHRPAHDPARTPCGRWSTYSWPGNIRQLENAIEHAVAMSGGEILVTALPEELVQPSASLLLPTVSIPDEGINFTSVVSQLERELILRCLEKTGGNKRQAARLLNLSRTTLIDKLHRLNLDMEASALSA